MRKFFVSSNQIVENEITILQEDVNHIRNVLRLDKGEQIKICNRDSSENYICQIVDIAKDYVKCEVLEKSKLDITKSEVIILNTKSDEQDLLVDIATTEEKIDTVDNKLRYLKNKIFVIKSLIV